MKTTNSKRRSRIITNDNCEPYFTNPDLAHHLVELLNKQVNLSKSFDAIVEPSAGYGAFVDAIVDQVKKLNIFAYDIKPNHHNVKKANFLKLENPVPKRFTRSRVLCVTNPPFGVRSQLASQFIFKCATFSDHIAMILPIAFLSNKYIDQRVPANYHVQWFKVLRNTKFSMPGNKTTVLNVAFIYFKNLGQPRRTEPRAKHRSRRSRNNSYFDILTAPTMAERKRADIRVRGTGYNAGEAFCRDHPKFFINKQRTDDWFVVLKYGVRNQRNAICKILNQTKWKFHNLVPNVKYLDRKQLMKTLLRTIQ